MISALLTGINSAFPHYDFLISALEKNGSAD
jgi:hypothetical protein